MENPTPLEIRQAAYAWLHATNLADVEGLETAYFENNWWALPGLKRHVEDQVARRSLQKSET